MFRLALVTLSIANTAGAFIAPRASAWSIGGHPTQSGHGGHIHDIRRGVCGDRGRYGGYPWPCPHRNSACSRSLHASHAERPTLDCEHPSEAASPCAKATPKSLELLSRNRGRVKNDLSSWWTRLGRILRRTAPHGALAATLLASSPSRADVLSALGGMDGVSSTSSPGGVGATGQPALVLPDTVSAGGTPASRGSGMRVGAGVADGASSQVGGGNAGIEGLSGRDTGPAKDSDIMRSIMESGSTRQAGPLTHGF